MIVGVPKETFPGEQRVALVPSHVPALVKAGFDVIVEAGAGQDAGFPDAAYVERGARVVPHETVVGTADVLLHVRVPVPEGGKESAGATRLRAGQVVIGLADPLGASRAMQEVARRGVTLFAMELIPRIARAQSMDVLSSMATVAGYKAVLLAAAALPRMFPLLVTAAGTINPARVFIVGVGVAGLQAIATARRLGGRVEAYDVRPEIKEQVTSLGARFVELPLETGTAEDAGGYARAQDEAFYRRQREMMARVVSASDVVITTAAVPGGKAPILVTEEMVAAMGPGSVVVDLAADRGGNCALTEPDRTVVAHGVTIIGPTNLPATIPHHASQMFSKNVTTFLLHAAKKGQLEFETADQIVRETLVTRDGDVVHPRIRELLGLVPAEASAS
jgi:NAD(P) transhydrogenase subunit alpha